MPIERCEFCKIEIKKDNCIFKLVKYNGKEKEICFCCQRHADEFQPNEIT